MKNSNKIIMAALALATASSSLLLTSVADAKGKEKCYGIVKAGMNDCQTSQSSCAGSAKKDSQGDAFLFLPKGICEKIVGSSHKPIANVADQ